MVKIGLQNAYRSRMKKSLGLSCIVNGVYVSPNILYPKFCWVIKGNRGGTLKLGGGGGHLKLTSDYRGGGGGGYVQWGGGGNLKVLHRCFSKRQCLCISEVAAWSPHPNPSQPGLLDHLARLVCHNMIRPPPLCHCHINTFLSFT